MKKKITFFLTTRSLAVAGAVPAVRGLRTNVVFMETPSRRKRILFVLLMAGLLFAGCRSRNSGTGEVTAPSRSADRAVAFSDLSYVKEFPQTFQVRTAPPETPFEAMGMLDLVAHGNTLYISGRSGSGLIAGYDKESGACTGTFLRTGNGPGEVLGVKYLSTYTACERRDGHLHYFLTDGKGKMLDIDFTASLEAGQPVVASSLDISEEPMMCALQLPDRKDTVFGTYVKPSFDGFDRFLLGPEGRTTTAAMEVLNGASSGRPGDGFLFNAVGIRANYHPGMGRIVECSIYLNTVQLYDVSGPFSRTVCLGSRLTDVESVVGEGLSGMHEISFSLKSYPEFFAVLTDESVRAGKKNAGQSILVLDWDGNPLVKLDLDRTVASFEFDVYAGRLYATDAEDNLWQADVSGFDPLFSSGRRFVVSE